MATQTKNNPNSLFQSIVDTHQNQNVTEQSDRICPSRRLVLTVCLLQMLVQSPLLLNLTLADILKETNVALSKCATPAPMFNEFLSDKTCIWWNHGGNQSWKHPVLLLTCVWAAVFRAAHESGISPQSGSLSAAFVSLTRKLMGWLPWPGVMLHNKCHWQSCDDVCYSFNVTCSLIDFWSLAYRHYP